MLFLYGLHDHGDTLADLCEQMPLDRLANVEGLNPAGPLGKRFKSPLDVLRQTQNPQGRPFLGYRVDAARARSAASVT